MMRRASWRIAARTRDALSRHKRLAGAILDLLDRVPVLQDALAHVARGDAEKRYRAWVSAYDTIDESELVAMRDELSSCGEVPLLSLVVPVRDVGEELLEPLAQSLLAQAYGRWEVSFACAGDVRDALAHTLACEPFGDSRFLPLGGSSSSSLAHSLNEVLQAAAGEFVVVVEPGVTLPAHALFLVARTIRRHPDAVLVYADEDRIDERGARSDHYFKPDWNEALLCSQNYLGALVACRRSVAVQVGGCHEDPDGDCMWGLFLRIALGFPGGTVHHVPSVLTHRRRDHPRDRVERQRVAHAQERRLALVGRQAEVEPVGEASYRAHYALPGRPPHVTVIIPSSCRNDLLHPCLDGVLNRTSYPARDVLLVVNEAQGNMLEGADDLTTLVSRPDVRVLRYEDRPFSFSWANNWAVEQARGELVCFLNDDTEVIAHDWLSAMVGHVGQERVAAVGAMLVHPRGRIQHAGVILGVGAVGGHALKGSRRGTFGYHDRAVVDTDVSAVTAACMLVRRDVFRSVGGFDETLAVSFNDVDLCLRLREAGWRIVWTPTAELYHRESASIGRHDVAAREAGWTAELSRFRGRWGAEVPNDPFYSPNLSLDVLQLWEPAFPPRVTRPWRRESAR